MKLREAPLAALLAISLVSAPTAAIGQDGGDSAVATSEGGGGTALAWGLAGLFAVVMGVIILSGDDDHDDEVPVSP